MPSMVLAFDAIKWKKQCFRVGSELLLADSVFCPLTKPLMAPSKLIDGKHKLNEIRNMVE